MKLSSPHSFSLDRTSSLSLEAQTLMRFWICCVFLLGLLFWPQAGEALIPEPDHIVYGNVYQEDTLLLEGVVEAFVSDEIQPIARYELENAGDGSYAVRLPMSSKEPRQVGTAQTGDAIEFYVNGFWAGSATVQGRGIAQRLDLGVVDLYQLPKDGSTLILDGTTQGGLLQRRVQVGDVDQVFAQFALNQSLPSGCGLELEVTLPDSSTLGPFPVTQQVQDFQEPGQEGIWIFTLRVTGSCAEELSFNLTLQAIAQVEAFPRLSAWLLALSTVWVFWRRSRKKAKGLPLASLA